MNDASNRLAGDAIRRSVWAVVPNETSVMAGQQSQRRPGRSLPALRSSKLTVSPMLRLRVWNREVG